MPNMDHDREIRDLKRRLDLTEAKLSQQAGSFEFITGQLRDVQLYMHARFDDMDKRFDGMDKRFDRLESEVKAIPRAIAELIDERLPRG